VSAKGIFMFFRVISVFFLFLFTNNAKGYFDFGVNYTYTKNVIRNNDMDSLNDDKKAVSTTEGINIGLGWFLWEYTALEFNYAVSVNKVIDDRSPQLIGTDLTLLSVRNQIRSEIKGVGIRQALAGRNARLIPSISVGYAEFTTSGLTTYFIDDRGEVISFDVEQEALVQSSSYASLQLRLKITELMGISFMARTVMPQFRMDDAENNITYSLGFSWVF
jgi:hypothetical protein